VAAPLQVVYDPLTTVPTSILLDYFLRAVDDPYSAMKMYVLLEKNLSDWTTVGMMKDLTGVPSIFLEGMEIHSVSYE
jgi:hypothetical protein